MQRHEIPTHLGVEDRAFLGLTMRQLMTAAVGLALAYGAFTELPLSVRWIVAAFVLAIVGPLTLWRPAGRPLEEWAFVLLRYRATPRVAVWRPMPASPDPERDCEPHGAVVRLPMRRPPPGRPIASPDPAGRTVHNHAIHTPGRNERHG